MTTHRIDAITTGTPLGAFVMLVHADTVRASGFTTVAELRLRLPRELQEIEPTHVPYHPFENFVKQYFEGDLTAISNIPHHQSGGDFYDSVWTAMSRIEPGHTLSYKQLAEQSTNPKAIRAVGTACGKNRVVLIVPCHRVIKSDGSVGTYLYGSPIKKQLLDHENRYSDHKP